MQPSRAHSRGGLLGWPAGLRSRWHSSFPPSQGLPYRAMGASGGQEMVGPYRSYLRQGAASAWLTHRPSMRRGRAPRRRQAVRAVLPERWRGGQWGMAGAIRVGGARACRLTSRCRSTPPPSAPRPAAGPCAHHTPCQAGGSGAGRLLPGRPTLRSPTPCGLALARSMSSQSTRLKVDRLRCASVVQAALPSPNLCAQGSAVPPAMSICCRCCCCCSEKRRQDRRTGMGGPPDGGWNAPAAARMHSTSRALAPMPSRPVRSRRAWRRVQRSHRCSTPACCSQRDGGRRAGQQRAIRMRRDAGRAAAACPWWASILAAGTLRPSGTHA